MPEIAIKQTLQGKGFREDINGSVESIRNFGREAKKIFESTRTPMEQYERQLQIIKRAQDEGRISAETYARAVAKAQQPAGGGVFAAGAQQLGGMFGAGGGLAMQAIFNPVTAGVAAIGGAGTLIASVSDHMLEIQRSAANLGVSLHVFQELEMASRLSGVGVQELGTAMQRFEKNTAIAVFEGGKARSAFEELGLSGEHLITESPEQALIDVARAISDLPNRFERARLEVELFGRSGAAMDTTLRNVAGGLDQYGKSLPTEEEAKSMALIAATREQMNRDAQSFTARATHFLADTRGGNALLMTVSPVVFITRALTRRANEGEEQPLADFTKEALRINEERQVVEAKAAGIGRKGDELLERSGAQKPLEKLAELERELIGLTGKKADEAHRHLEGVRRTLQVEENLKKIFADQKKEMEGRAKLEEQAARFGQQMADQAEKLTHREAELVGLARRGLPQAEAMRLAAQAAGLDAGEELAKGHGRTDLANAPAAGSLGGYQLQAAAMERAKGGAQPDKEKAVTERLDRIHAILKQIYQKDGPKIAGHL